MKKNYVLLLLLCVWQINAQVFDVATIQNNGDPDKHINLVIMGDGYTATQQDDFLNTANSISNYLFSISPWAQYKNYFNVYAIKVIANESGVKHANTSSDCSSYFTEVSNPTNYFGTRFDGFGIHRLTIAPNTTRITNVLAANFPNYDQVFIVGNSPQYGGSGGAYAVFTANTASSEIAAHEMGHSFAGLADEYYAGDQYFAEKINMTQESDETLIKWKNWLEAPNSVGIVPYCCGGNSDLWFKPNSGSCKMEQLNLPYCSVCKEGIVEKIHSLVNTILSFTPANATAIEASQTPIDFQLTELLRPIPNTLHIKWQFDTTISDTNSETFQLNPTALTDGLHILTASVVDETPLIRVDNHATVHISTVTWSINKSNLGVQTNTTTNKIAYTLYPNPTSEVLHLAFDLEQPATVAIDIVSLDGKIVQQFAEKKMVSGKFEENLAIENIAVGSYIAVVKINGAAYNQTFVKN
ncbi:M64 family metallopeptidase [Flavobacterium sp.]|uniref:M64 family metallopeptidase n=1 Tax=Flavobacterium sp. TaxID=239 RepID=UPI00263805C0|nr:M64 family metallopeptidase [Flavobacterium sp.]